MKSILAGVCAFGLAVAGSSLAVAQEKAKPSQSSTEVQQDTKVTKGNNKTTKTSTDVVSGKVETYEAGKSIKVSVPGKISTSKSFDLDSKDETINVPADVKVGDWVKVSEKTDNNGHKTVTVSHTKAGKATKTSS
jgi:hypothetical protein